MYRDGERMMAWVATIDQVQNHPNADRLDLCRVGGWQVVTLRDEYKEGDRVIYISIDSWVPTEIASFLSKGQEPRVYEGVKGERLRTVKLRGEISQGLILPFSILGPYVDFPLEDGADVTDHLGIIKWEPPISAQLAGQVEGNFPSFIRKTDQERCVEGNTIIETDDGLKTIKEIVESKFAGKVLSYEPLINQNVMRKVVGWSEMTPQPNEWVKITTRSGKFMIVTNNHKVYLPSLDIYREARFLRCGDKVRIV